MRRTVAGPRFAGLVLFLVVSLVLPLFPVLPARASYEEPVPEGQLLAKRVGLGYAVVWKSSSGAWLDNNGDGDPEVPGPLHLHKPCLSSCLFS